MRYRLTTLLMMRIKNSLSLESSLTREAFDELITSTFTSFEKIVCSHNGKIEKDPLGRYPESALASFEGPTSALRAAWAFKTMMKESKAVTSCAVHTGEVVVRNNAIMGRTLDITTRLEGIAGNGEILFTESVLLSSGCNSELVYHPHLTSLEGISGPQMSIFRLEEIGVDNGES